MVDNTDPKGEKAKNVVEEVVGYVKTIFRGRPIGGDELKGTSGDKPIAVTLKNRTKAIDKELEQYK